MKEDIIIIVGGGLLQVPAVEIAKNMGLKVAVTDASAAAPALQLADEPCVVDIYDLAGHESVVNKLREKYNVKGVFTEGADVEVTVAATAQYANVRGIPVEAALNTKNKARMRACFDKAGINNPQWKEVNNLADADVFAEEIGYPLVVKSVDNCASRGTSKVFSKSELADAVGFALDNSTTQTVLIESCFSGEEQSIEIIFDMDGNCHNLNVVDRIFLRKGKFALELGHVNPSGLSLTRKEELFALTRAAANATGVHFGVFKADTIWTEEGPRILEVTARLSGGFDCQYTTPLSTGRNFIRAAMCTALGLPIDFEDLQNKIEQHSAAWVAWPVAGIVKSIELAQAYATHGVKHIFLRAKPGDEIGDYENCAQRPAFVIAVGKTWQEALDNAQNGAQAIVFDMEDC